MISLGVEKCSYNKDFFENGSVTKARNESQIMLVEKIEELING